MRRHALIALALAALLTTAGCAGTTPSQSAAPSNAQQPTSASEDGTIHVVGSGSAEATPNQAIVGVAVVATAEDAATARQRLAENVSRMRAALAEIGLEDDQITTRRYDIDRVRRRPPEEGSDPAVEYRAWHAFEITVTETDRVGTVVDTAVRNGATEVDNIEFTLSTDLRRELEADARGAAMADAREKAESLASDANLTVTGVNVIRTDGGGAPRPAEYATAAATATPTEAGTDLESGPVTVVTTVRVVYTAEPTDEGETGSG
jgi:hypothetical protein